MGVLAAITALHHTYRHVVARAEPEGLDEWHRMLRASHKKDKEAQIRELETEAEQAAVAIMALLTEIELRRVGAFDEGERDS